MRQIGSFRRGQKLVNKEINYFLPWRRCHSVLLDEYGSPRCLKLFELFQSEHLRRTGTHMNLNTNTDITSTPIRTPIPKRVSCPSCRFLVNPVAYLRFFSRKPSLLDLSNSVQEPSSPCWALTKLVSSTARMVNIPSQSGSSPNTQLTRSCVAVVCLPSTVLPRSPVTTVPLPLREDQATSVSRIPGALLFYFVYSFCAQIRCFVQHVHKWKPVQRPSRLDTSRPQYKNYHRSHGERTLCPKPSVVPCRPSPNQLRYLNT